MAAVATLYTVYEDDPVLVDARIDIYFDQGNGSQWFSTSLLIPRDSLRTGYDPFLFMLTAL